MTFAGLIASLWSISAIGPAQTPPAPRKEAPPRTRPVPRTEPPRTLPPRTLPPQTQPPKTDPSPRTQPARTRPARKAPPPRTSPRERPDPDVPKHPALQLKVGPYLQNLRKDAVILKWIQHLSGPASVRYRRQGAKAWQTVKIRSRRRAKQVEIKKLTPSTRYRYEVIGPDNRRYGGTFVTAPEPDKPFTFLLIGDMRSGFEMHQAMVDAMRLEQASFVICTGDVVFRGRRELYLRFFSIERELLRHIPFLPALGNHELSSAGWRGRPLFREFFENPRNGPDPGIVYSYRYGNSMFLFLDSNNDFVGADQTSWAADQLLQANGDKTIRHIFVTVHHGPFSSGPHGPNHRLLDSGLIDRFVASGVDIIFSGHDHIYDRGEHKGLRYVVTAGGGAPLYPTVQRQPYSRVALSEHHYVRVNVVGDQVELVARRPDGSIIDTFRYVKLYDRTRSRPKFVTLHDGAPVVGKGKRGAGPARQPRVPRKRGVRGLTVLILAAFGLAALAMALWLRLKWTQRKAGDS